LQQSFSWVGIATHWIFSFLLALLAVIIRSLRTDLRNTATLIIREHVQAIVHCVLAELHLRLVRLGQMLTGATEIAKMIRKFDMSS